MANKTTKILTQLRDQYGDEVMGGWLNLYGFDVTHHKDGTWSIGIDEHDELMGVEDVANGHGVWTGIQNEAESWVFSNGEEVYSILSRVADENEMSVWTYLAEECGLADVCDWALESILKRELIGYNLVRYIGLAVGNIITDEYQSLGDWVDL